MKHIIVAFGVLVALIFLGGAAFIYSGVYNVAATDPHWPVTYWVMEQARMRAIRVHAAGIVAPADLNSHARIVGGAAHFMDHCAGCHSAPGVPADDFSERMYPRPPVLADVSRRYSAKELFWVVKNGIKMSGMPAWADHGDEDLWNVVAFLRQLPAMNAADYTVLAAEARDAGGHHRNGMTPMDGGMSK